MSKDKAEEKAREYAGVTPDVKDISQLPPYFYVQRQKYKDYLAGYTQAEQGLSAENEKLKEALREVISRYDILERSVMVHPDYVFGDDNDEWHTFIYCGKELLNEAKQLLTDNTQDNENN